MKLTKHLLFFLLFVQATIFAQNDTIVFDSSNRIVGEIKSLSKGIITVKTDYSDSDFQIEWKKVNSINTKSRFLVTLSSSPQKYLGRIVTLNDSITHIYTRTFRIISCELNDIVDLSPQKSKLIDRFDANVDIGFNLTKAKNLKQLNISSGIAYHADQWSADAIYDQLRTSQDDVEEIQRIESKLNYRLLLPKRYYAFATIATLTNTEQQLDLRLNSQIGTGKYLFRTNSKYWGAKVGINRNNETYSNEIENRSSWEYLLGTELNLYDIGDFNLLTVVTIYPAINEDSRFRSDFNIDLKYDLPLDFYIKGGFSVNYDNQPAEGSPQLDYVFQTGFGWEL